MSGFFFVLAMLLLLASSAFGIWMLVLSFRTSVLWGLAVLFLPFAVVVFAIVHWDECKKPFLWYMGTSVAGFMLLFLTVGAAVGEAAQLAAEEQAQMTESDDSNSDSDPIDWENEQAPSSASVDPYPSTRATRPMRPAPSVQVTRDPSRVLPGGKIKLSQAREYIGEAVRVIAHDGRLMKGLLIEVRPDRFVIEQELRAGVISFDVARSEVEALELSRY